MIDHINIVVADLERAAHFYETLFGFKRGFGAVLQGDWIQTVTGLDRAKAQCLFLDPPDAGATRIELIRYDAPENEFSPFVPKPNEPGLRHIAFEVADIDVTLNIIRALGIAPISDAVEVPFRVADLGRQTPGLFSRFRRHPRRNRVLSIRIISRAILFDCLASNE